MTVFFTLCSCNYLAQAKTLGQTLMQHNPEVQYVIGLVDKLDGRVAEEYWSPFELIEVEELAIPGFDALCEKYNTVELNTAVKPFLIEHLYSRDSEVSSVIYLDPDIMVFSAFDDLEENLENYNIVLIPHSSTESSSEQAMAYERAMLQTGIYNLGFIATRRSDETFRMLKWWQTRLLHFCFYRPTNGLFVDQIWANFMPLYYDGVLVDINPGYNMCYWNHFEREVTESNGVYMVNTEYKLVFYHFSSYNPLNPSMISNRDVSHPLSERPDLEEIFTRYTSLLMDNDYMTLAGLQPYYAQFHKVRLLERVLNWARKYYRKYLS